MCLCTATRATYALTLLIFASSSLAADVDAMAALRATLQSRFPDVKIDQIEPAPVAGLYAVVAGDRIVYADLTGEHLVMGPLLETLSRRNLTDERLGEIHAIDFDSLPFSLAMKTVRGNGQRRLAVFADPHCPYCQQLEESLEHITDVTIFTFLYPLESIHPGATARAHKIWCAEDSARAWLDWMLRDQIDMTRECEGDPLAQLQQLGQSLKINSTPTIFLADGRRIPGALSRDEIERLLAMPVPPRRVAKSPSPD